MKFTQREIDYIILLTSLDMFRIDGLVSKKDKNYALETRHSVRRKLMEVDISQQKRSENIIDVIKREESK